MQLTPEESDQGWRADQESRLDYLEVRRRIQYHLGTAEAFDDPWSRWPPMYGAQSLAQKLRSKGDWWKQTGYPEQSRECMEAADELLKRAE